MLYCIINALEATEVDVLWENENIIDSKISDSEKSETDFDDGRCESE